MSDHPAIDRLLLVKTSSIGDVVHALPAVTSLRRRHPTMRLTWAVEEWVADLVSDHPAVDRVVRLPPMRMPRSGSELAAWLRHFREALNQLRSEPYDLALDLQGLAKSSAVVLASRAKRRLGIDGQREGAWLVTRAMKVRAPGRHAVEENLRAVELFGADSSTPRFDLPVDERARESVVERLRGEGIPVDRPVIVIGPSASSARKTPPARLWHAIVEGFAPLGTPLVVGTPEQRLAHGEISNGAGCRDWTGATSLRELVALLERAALVVAPDSGTAHIAAALGRPVVSLFGPTPPERLAPYGQSDRVIRREGICGSSCRFRCTRLARCLAAIDPAAVMAAARRALG